MTDKHPTVEVALRAEDVELLHFLIGCERGRIWRDSPEALDSPEPGSWAKRVDDLYGRFTHIRDSNLAPLPR